MQQRPLMVGKCMRSYLTRRAAWNLAPLAFLAGLAGASCDDDETGTGGGGGTIEPPPGPVYVIDIVVDANRDGVANAEDPADQDNEEVWDVNSGAMFLPNLDDDDGDQVRDAEDNRWNGGTDSYDLAGFQSTACPECPEGSYAYLEIDAASAPYVRIWAIDESWTTWRLVAGELGQCMEADPTCQAATSFELTTLEVQQGTLFAIEARDFLRDQNAAWKGYVDLTFSVFDANGEPLVSETNPDGVDKARMRVAPWQLFGNLSPFDNVWSSDTSSVFVAGIQDATDAAAIDYTTYSNYGDQWTQDFFQTGFFAMPALIDGQLRVHGMKVANARPWGRSSSDSSLPINWLKNNYLGPDQATIAVYEQKHSGDSYDSHGNHDLIPPYTNGAESFPLGRILIGSGVLDETKAFYDAQGLQSPHLAIDTSWLLVGHVDEYLSYVPANTPRGWKLLVSSPSLAREMLLDAQAAGNGAVQLHVGKFWYDFNTGGTYPAAISIDEVLALPDVAEASQAAQTEIDNEVDKLKQIIGLTDDEIVEMPNLFGQQVFGGTKYKVAYQPGTVNSLVFGDYIVIPKPFGPNIGGVDIFEADLEARLGTAVNGLGAQGQGLQVYFTDDWDVYHRLDGEVHCGSNPEASAPFSSVNWWSTGR